MRKKPTNLKELIQGKYAFIAKLPQKNNFLLKNLDNLEGYTVPLIGHDYSAKTSFMWNTLYEKLGLNIRNIMLVANPKKNAEIIMDALRLDSKYFGGGWGVGWKEKIDLLDKTNPKNLASVNMVVKNKNKYAKKVSEKEVLEIFKKVLFLDKE